MLRDCKLEEDVGDQLWSIAEVRLQRKPRARLDGLEANIAGMCVSDACTILGIHQAHPVSQREDKLSYTSFSTIQEITFDYVRDYEARVFGQIYNDVVNVYGAVQTRVVQRALQHLAQDRKIVLVTARGARTRAKRLDRLYGAYIRWTSPLLFDPDGVLFDQAEDLLKTNARAGR